MSIKGEVFTIVSETRDMTSEGLEKMFEGDSACAGKFPLVLMWGQVDGLALNFSC
jgi:hypothetical protein